MTITRRALLGAVAAGVSASSFSAYAEDVWPSRMVRLISPYGPGGSNDISLRLLAEEFSRSLRQQFIVENKPGAGTRIANDMVAHAPGDGYTILYVAAPYATAEALFGKLTYERGDLQPIAMAVIASLFLIISADAPFKTLPDLIAYGKSKPDGLTFASPGAGSQPHLAGELLFRDAGVKGLNIPFRGDAASYTELLAGRVDATLTALPTALPYIQSGKFTVLGVASAERSALYPQAPTLREQGFPNVVAAGWYGFMVPSTTPRAVVDKLQAEVLRALAEPAIKDKLTAQGLEVRAGTAAEFGQFIDAETQKWARLIRDAGLKGE
ncbi:MULTISPECIES: Bug family tripartite tricarboxylate transporter substrate binding protein [Bradyrhizobium]|uniref:Bug family tripartite tricarboxylate transporter substrate binding protein n=1 Tax=Bradyrhizobium TaxID=374 RepID=UPI00155F4E07|nr:MULTISPECIES: tripartite tricarboxylate transporter substrate binding protein [Bradyrhizobium]MDD1516578.1 tripartite tricarboxylate transporter substrate binding protein [Bradyrhizobium sp. WBAH30]MDD1542784.1 tripartite tricarboxylate transporter substrate binding protein [Bradyrhizobium sp. WBAH41]MDD1554481.1 tripartite tricarboxylate transporter substrate binding protein [Bradyrhizobium sp. WBAH23]MDD1562432.1 tripartite tricarboxylate transporter substrate binding protein [Bradyrhizobi